MGYSKRWKILSISTDLMLDILRQFLGAERPKTWVVVNNGIPEDAKVCRVGHDFKKDCLQFAISSDEFDLVPSNEYPPDLLVELQAVRNYNMSDLMHRCDEDDRDLYVAIVPDCRDGVVWYQVSVWDHVLEQDLFSATAEDIETAARDVMRTWDEAIEGERVRLATQLANAIPISDEAKRTIIEDADHGL